MRPTRRGRLLLVAAVALLFVGLLALSAGPAAVGVAILAYLAYTRTAASDAFDRARLEVTRSIAEPRLHEGAPFHVELVVRPARFASGVSVAVRDELPPGVDAREPAEGTGEIVRYSAIPRVRGEIRFERVVVRWEDSRGLWEKERARPLEARATVLPSAEAVQVGRAIGRRTPLEASVRNRIGLLLRDLEFESERPYVHGDRMRDVDWKRFSQFEEMLTKTWEKETEADVVLLLDVSRTMRARRGPASKVDHAVRIALQLAAAAGQRNHRIGLVAFDELGVVDVLPPTRDRAFPRLLAERAAKLPTHVEVERRLEVGLSEGSSASDAEVDFLETLASFRSPGRRRGRGIEAALTEMHLRSAASALFVVALTDLESSPQLMLRGLARASSEGHRVVAVVLPGTAFLAPPHEPGVRELEAAYREIGLRRKARGQLAALGVHVVELTPEDTARPIAEASRGRGPGRVAKPRGGVR